MQLTIRDATPKDAPLIACVEIEASRSGTPLGFWDASSPAPTSRASPSSTRS